MKHRGRHSNDDKIFNQKWLTILKEATSDLSFLLGRGYGLKSSVALVGNHYHLNARQQRVLSLITCPDNNIEFRQQKSLAAQTMSHQNIVIDGFNLLITIEAILAGGYIFVCQDGCYRDIASVHGSYKKVMETLPAIELIAQSLEKLGIDHAQWYFDSPISNAGMLKTLLYDYAKTNQYRWDIELVTNPDTILADSCDIVISSDSVIIDDCQHYFNLSKYIVNELIDESVHTVRLCQLN